MRSPACRPSPVWQGHSQLFHRGRAVHARALLTGLPVKDQRALLNDVDPAKWREIAETVDGFARILPQLVLLTAVWQRSFPTASRLIGAA